MKYLITGKGSKLGAELIKHLSDYYGPSSRVLDVTLPETIKTAIAYARPKAIIHLAAISSIERASQEKYTSYRVNVMGTRNLATEAGKTNTKIYYISTDYVFDCIRGGYTEKDKPNPANWYGYTKYAGEMEIQHILKNFCIIRTSFRPQKWPFPTAFTNVYTSGDYTDVIAKEIALTIAMDCSGIIHIGTGKKSFFELASIRNPDIKPELCLDRSVPKRRDLNINKWLKLKKTNRKLH